MAPVTKPDKGVWTPDAEFIADRPKDAVMGIDPMKDPINWQAPSATISWDASIFLLDAINRCPKSVDQILLLLITYEYRIWQWPNVEE